jgi:hypothetical protein
MKEKTETMMRNQIWTFLEVLGMNACGEGSQSVADHHALRCIRTVVRDILREVEA